MNFAAPIESAIQDLAKSIAGFAGSEPPVTVSIRGGGTKPTLHARPTVTDQDLGRQETVSTQSLNGIIEYDPGEFTITAYAGTPLNTLKEALAEKGQYLPFDPPPLIHPTEQTPGTLGGAIASGINGPGRWRYGGIRDFVMETRWIDGTGNLRTGGRRVVKNAAGFDFPKLMTGSCGRLGMMVDLTLKVFPRPKETVTLHIFCENPESAAAAISRIAMQPWELDALEIQPDCSLLIRLSGEPQVLTEHGSRLQKSIQDSCSNFLLGEAERQVWQDRHQWIWDHPDQAVLRVPMNLRTMLDLDEELEELEIQRCYGSAGNVGWLKWYPQKENPGARMKRIAKLLNQMGLHGQLVYAPESLLAVHPPLILGKAFQNPFLQRIKQTFDPRNIFGDFDAT